MKKDTKKGIDKNFPKIQNYFKKVIFFIKIFFITKLFLFFKNQLMKILTKKSHQSSRQTVGGFSQGLGKFGIIN